jgi:hypothetical protein
MKIVMARVLPNFTVAPHFFILLHNRIYIIAFCSAWSGPLPLSG